MPRINDLTYTPFNVNDYLNNYSEQTSSMSQEQRCTQRSRWENQNFIEFRKEVAQRRESQNLPLQVASSITTQPIRWAYNNWLPEAELTVLVGAPGSGKTAFACTLAAGITKGNDCQLRPDLKVNGGGHVIIVNNEDSVERTLVPRLLAAGANLSFVHFIDTKSGKANESPFSFLNDRDMNRLIGLSKQLNNNIGLILIDPIYLAVEGDHGNNHKARHAYERLAMLAKQLQCAILGIAHAVRNPSGKEPLARVAGTPALREVPRGIMLLSKIAHGPTASGGTHVLVHAKNSLGSIDDGFEYSLQEIDLADLNADPNALSKGLKFTITEAKFGSAEEILKEADRPKPVETLNKTKIAEEFLLNTLKDGPKLLIDIQELALKANVTKGTLMQAKSNLNIKTKKREGDGRSVWSLPDWGSRECN